MTRRSLAARSLAALVAACLALGAALAVEAATCLPTRVGFYDEEHRTLHPARIVWTKDAACGLVFLARPFDDRRVRGGFGGDFYALGAPARLARAVLR